MGLKRARSLVSELSLRINHVKRQIDQGRRINNEPLQVEETKAAGSIKQGYDPPDISDLCDNGILCNREEDSRSPEPLSCEDGKNDKATRNDTETRDMEGGEVIDGLTGPPLFSYVNYTLDFQM